MPRNVFALLVGIDAYRKPVPPLSGCVNDIEAIASYLEERVGGQDGTTLSLKSLKDDKATRDAIVAGFRGHLAQAKSGDVALFYYAGHGSQEPAPPEFWHLEPDKLDETLVLYDSRNPGKFDLADKELAKLIDEVAAGGAHVAVILDCCHSGSGTRNALDGDVAVRRAPLDDRPRPLASFLVGVDEANRLEANRLEGKRGMSGDPPAVPAGRHVLLAACRDEQVASEYRGDGKSRGAFSYFLGDTLSRASGPITYRDLFARTQSVLQRAIGSQAPQIESTRPEDLDALFLDGAIRPAEPSYTISTTGEGWVLNAGAVHGVPRGEGPDAVTLSLFPFDSPPETLRDRSKALGSARVTEVRPTTCLVELKGIADSAANATYKAVVATWPLPALAVGLEGDAAAIDLARAALAKAGPNGSPSLYVCEGRAGDTPAYRLLARNDQYLIAGPVGDRPLVGQLDGYSEVNARKSVERLEHMACWSLATRMANPASTIRPDEVAMTIFRDDVELKGPEIRLEYRREGDRWVAPKIKVRLENTGDRRLYVAMLNLTETFKIWPGLQPSGSVRLDPGQEAWSLADKNKPVTLSVPDEVWKQGVVEYRDILKLLVCTDEFDAGRMAQPALDLPRSTFRDVPRGSLNRLMQRVQTRDMGDDEPAALDDWTAFSVTFTTVRPQESVPIPQTGEPSRELTGGVTIQPHHSLRAQARLSTALVASRGLGDLALPRLLQEHQATSEPFSLAPTRSTAPGLSVLELSGVEGHEAVTPEQPLRLESPMALAEGEHVLPVGFDGEFFLPLGRSASLPGGGTEIILERLPDPTTPEGTTRSLTGSIRIFFQKVTAKVLGREFKYPLLAAADIDDHEVVTYETDVAKVAARVAKSNTILLMIHGIIGDTLELRRGARRAKVGAEQAPLDSRYDLVLTFDYENLNTPIEDVARSLKTRLETVGLGADHGKALDIAAHSMGGLVSRWFIEREGGNRVVRKLVMLGTPNGGSPWPSVHDWAITTLSLALNSLAGVAWPAAAAGWLVGKLEDLDVNLDQMQPDSAFLKKLAKGEDPGIPYVMVAGNTSLIPAALEGDASGTSLLGRLIGKLFRKPLLHTLAEPFFKDQANDIATSIPSMENVPGPRNPAYEVRPVACDHISYFADEAGLKALVEALVTIEPHTGSQLPPQTNSSG